jgi:hypothetical protein
MSSDYCDNYTIADRISKLLRLDIEFNTIYTCLTDVGPAKLDLHPVHGYYMSAVKIVKVVDKNGKTYTISVMEDTK